MIGSTAGGGMNAIGVAGIGLALLVVFVLLLRFLVKVHKNERGHGLMEKTKGEIYEGIAFQFCKVATVALLAGRFVLPVAAGLCAAFYAAAYAQGKRDTRCILRYPLLLTALWGFVAVASLYLILNPKFVSNLFR